MLERPHAVGGLVEDGFEPKEGSVPDPPVQHEHESDQDQPGAEDQHQTDGAPQAGVPRRQPGVPRRQRQLPQALPRYLPVDVDRPLSEVLTRQPENPLAAAGLRLQRTCGLRIGELLDLDLFTRCRSTPAG
jgi:hypothetical protein